MMPFEKLSEDELEHMTEEERAGYDEELAAYESGYADGDDTSDGDDDGEGVDDDELTGEDEEGDDSDAETDNDDDAETDPLDDQTSDDDAGADSGDESVNGGDNAETADDDETGDELPADFQPLPNQSQFRDEIQEQFNLKRELARQFDEGEISATEKAEKEIEIDEALYDLRSKQANAERALTDAKNDWIRDTVPSFLSEHSQYTQVPGLHKALDRTVRELQTGKYAGNPFHPGVLKDAHALVRKSFAGMMDQAEKPANEPKAGKVKTAPKNGRKFPPSLRNVPAAAVDDISGDGSEFAYLDRLASKDPLAYDAALEKLSESELDRYMQSA